ncbi:MAG TPA: tetratricopeptide repeat protein, partial [Tepidisphaeraceae bacterium]|nr:tetratricopeptide repeat protein [Tepidisphaeraceae bacterium]
MKSSLFAELRRRNVLRAGAFYIAATWALAQGIAQLGPAVGLPEWATRWFLVAAIIGFPFWIAFAWLFEFTPEGIKRERNVEPHESITHHTGRKLDFAIIGVLAIAVVLLATDRFVLHFGVKADTAISAQSIAVLPFVDMSQSKDQEYFSDGISEELLNLLAKIQTLHVAARTSSFSFKGKDLPIPEIAKTLHVANVLEGSVRKAGDRIRITAQLIRAADGYHVWSQTWDRELDDIFKIQDEIAGKVVEELKVTLLGAAPKARTTDPEAYALYLQAIQLGRQGTAEAYQRSDALYRKVLTIDARYAPAWSSLGANLSNEAGQGLLPAKQGYAEAREAATKALAIDPEYAPAHARLGRIAMYGDNDLAAAAEHFKHAVALDPADLDVMRNSAVLLSNLGRLNEALALDDAVVRRDPVNVSALFNLGLYQRMGGRIDAAITSFRTVLSLSPGSGNAHAQLGTALLLKGQASDALAEIEQETSEVDKMISLPMAYHALGRKAESDAALAALIAKYEKDSPYNIAYVYAYCGEVDNAFAWLDKAVEYGDSGLAEIVSENLLDNIHADPRW